jgi:multidrug resistance efflux pump
MKRLSTIFLVATALAFAGTPTAMAQQTKDEETTATPASRRLTKTVETTTPTTVETTTTPASRRPDVDADPARGTLPLAEARKRYQQSEQQLRDLAERKVPIRGFAVEFSEATLDRLDLSAAESRDQVRNAVAEAYEARQQLQAAELAELERRIAGIKRAMALRETMKETIIDQRTEELLDAIEKRENGPEEKKGSDSADAAKPGKNPRPAAGYDFNSANKLPGGSKSGDPFGTADPRLGPQARKRLLEIDAAEAELAAEAAMRAYERAAELVDTGAMTHEALEELHEKCVSAKVRAERAKVLVEAFVEANPAAADTSKTPPNKNRAVAPVSPHIGEQAEMRLLQLDVEEAEATLAAAERAYQRGKALYDTGTLGTDAYDKLSEELNHAKIQLERTKVKAQAQKESAAASARVDLSKAKINFKNAENQYQDAKKMHEKGYVTQDDVDIKAETLNAANAKLTQAQANLDAAGTSDTSVDDIIWGEPSPRSIQLGWRIRPSKEEYKLGDVVTANLFLRNAGEQPISFAYPKAHELLRLGLRLSLTNASGENLRCNQWPVDFQEDSRFDAVTMASGALHHLPGRFIVIGANIGGDRLVGIRPILADLDVKPGQSGKLTFRLSAVGIGKGDKEPLESKPFEFRVASGTAPTNGQAAETGQNQRLLELDVAEAEVKLDAAQRDYERYKEAHDAGAVEQSVLSQKANHLDLAKIQLERAKVNLEAFKKRPNQGSSAADGSATEIETNRRLAQLDVEEAEASLAATQIQYERYQRLRDTNSIEQSLLDEQADQYKRAQKQLERAKIQLKALSTTSTGALEPASGEHAAEARPIGVTYADIDGDGDLDVLFTAKDAVTITLAETGEGKPAAIYLGNGKVGSPLAGTLDEQDDQIRQAVKQAIAAGERRVLIKAQKGVPHREVSRVAEAAGSVEGASLHLAVAEEGGVAEE